MHYKLIKFIIFVTKPATTKMPFVSKPKPFKTIQPVKKPIQLIGKPVIIPITASFQKAIQSNYASATQNSKINGKAGILNFINKCKIILT